MVRFDGKQGLFSDGSRHFELCSDAEVNHSQRKVRLRVNTKAEDLLSKLPSYISGRMFDPQHAAFLQRRPPPPHILVHVTTMVIPHLDIITGRIGFRT
ncbi:hypothetical protein AVEN_71551-1 [Araneus ventricosus]|uniref:Uncharacterized protein n=1 Tax=Araneus ventricosus TaxID=182803 RepID=A0A4Y2EWN4_ARAVE|nr:hypothetical protein AVEN_71551-1 [Araneus ventricosus]